MSTIQVDDNVKRDLFAVAAELQSRLGKKVSLSEAIRALLEAYGVNQRDVPRMLSLFGCLGPRSEARGLLREIRAKEEIDVERLARKYNA